MGGDLVDDHDKHRLSTSQREQITQAIYSLMTESQRQSDTTVSR